MGDDQGSSTAYPDDPTMVRSPNLQQQYEQTRKRKELDTPGRKRRRESEQRRTAR